MRNDCARIALEHKCDYLMFIDDDVAVKPNTYESLRAADKDVVMAITYVRGYPFHPMFFKHSETIDMGNGKLRRNLAFHDDYEDSIDENGLVKTGAVGFSCVLIKVDVMRAMTPPYFVTGPGHTEDVYFCLKAAAELEPEPTIYVDTKVSTSHQLMPDMVDSDNVKKLREFYKPELDENDAIKFRMKDHIEQVMQEMSKNASA